MLGPFSRSLPLLSRVKRDLCGFNLGEREVPTAFVPEFLFWSFMISRGEGGLSLGGKGFGAFGDMSLISVKRV